MVVPEADTAPNGRVGLPDDMREWVEQTCGDPVVSATRQSGGGRKEAWMVDVGADGDTKPLFLRWDRSDPRHTGDPWTIQREAAVYRALGPTAVPVAQLVGVHPTAQAMLVTRVEGNGWFSHITDEAEQLSVAKDFIGHLATLHRLTPSELAVDGWDAAATCPQLAAGQLDEMDALIAWRGGRPDPLLALALRWLRANVPDYDGPTVLVQGDTGPGNFMYASGKVTAIVDWELAHYGDPMDDIAWVTLRSVQEPFTDLAARFAEYERLSGHRLDADRIRYYRVLAEAKILVMGHGVDPRLRFAGGADLGGRLIFGQLHRRLCAEALADVLGRDLPDDRELGAAPGTPPEPRDSDAVFDAILAQLRDTIVPRIDDPLAASRAKGIARAVKYLAVATRLEDAFREDELDDLGRLLGGTRPATIAEGRDALSAAITTGAVADADALSVLHRRVLRDDIMLRDASGALGRRHYAPVAELVARAE